MTTNEHRFTAASRYVASLRSAVKRKYAHEYYQWLRCPEHMRGLLPDPGSLSCMAAQAVRMNLDEIMERPDVDAMAKSEADSAEEYHRKYQRWPENMSARCAEELWGRGCVPLNPTVVA